MRNVRAGYVLYRALVFLMQCVIARGHGYARVLDAPDCYEHAAWAETKIHITRVRTVGPCVQRSVARPALALVLQATPFNLREKEGLVTSRVVLLECNNEPFYVTSRYVYIAWRALAYHSYRRAMFSNNARLLCVHVTMVTLKSCNLIGRSRMLERKQLRSYQTLFLSEIEGCGL